MSSKASQPTPASSASSFMPFGAIAAGVGLSLLGSAAIAQQAPEAGQTLPAITVKGQADKTPEAKQGYQATTTNIGKGKQALRDIPQSMTVHTERLMDDRNLDDFRDVLRTTAGVTFQAGETGEEDVRLRGFSLLQAGDIYVDGLRDPALQERDTFNHDRIEVLKGSASMLFGRGSTGGVVNQVSKQPFLFDQHEIDATVGSGKDYRLTGDFNIKTGESSAFRVNAMVQDAERWGATIDKKGIAPTYRFGIGEKNEFSVGLYHLEFDNRPLYNHPWVTSETGSRGKIQETLPAKNYYGQTTDYNKGSATYGTLSHIHRFGGSHELKTVLRHGRYERDLWASVIRGVGIPPTNTSTDVYDNPNQPLSRTQKGRFGETDVTYLGTIYTGSTALAGLKHNLIAGAEWMQEDAKRNNNTASGFTPSNPPEPTTVGTPNDGGTADSPRDVVMNSFDAKTFSVFGQDVIELTPELKLLAGLRFDYFNYDFKNNISGGQDYSRIDRLWTRRFGLIYQPSDWASYHVSYGTSFNTSGDTYSLSAANADIAPEKSRNVEVGAKFDLFDNRLFVGTSLFHTTKYRERNTDPDLDIVMLSGKRHALGIDLDIAGRITPNWEAFVSYTWIPEAEIDKSTTVLSATGTGAQIKSDRPGLTPKHMASLWTTYRVLPALRIGGGLNYRGEQSPEGQRLLKADDFTTLDLMAEYTINQTFVVKFNVKNATDELYADSLYRGFYAPGAPRSYQLSLKAKF